MTRSGTPSTVRDRAGARRLSRDLWNRTALCGALVGVVSSFTTPAMALPVLANMQSQVSVSGEGPSSVGRPGGVELDITLHAPRTVIDWSSYDVAAGEKVSYAFNARNWIVLNRINEATPPTINGIVEGRVNGAYGGNIWFASRNGMIFGPGARVDAGGILVTTASPGPDDVQRFLDPNNLTFNFSGEDVADGAMIAMQAGSSINGHGGLVALIAPTIVTEAGSSVTGLNGSDVLYGVTTGYQLRLAQGAPGDFDLVDFLIPSTEAGSGSTIGLDLQNTTTANSVFVAMVSRADASSAVINLQGMITAQAATADGGDIILSGSGGIVGKAIGPSLGGTNTDIYLHLASASRDIQL
ncbi:MAG TPA: filamentous hemagglutinin N-terminal domain-containing protein, partial [Phenylobacterium sp.]|nr:filamentous hemagglutinin N-terminal domain-containing protein [Phenylobacterium sp.]